MFLLNRPNQQSFPPPILLFGYESNELSVSIFVLVIFIPVFSLSEKKAQKLHKDLRAISAWEASQLEIYHETR